MGTSGPGLHCKRQFFTFIIIMECLIGIKFRDFVIMATDMSHLQSIMVQKGDEDKMHKLSSHLVMAVAGEAGDTTQFSEYIAKNIQLYKMRNGYELAPSAAASFTRRNLADYLRSRTPYSVNPLIAGFDKETGKAELYFMDHLASRIQTKYAAHGYGGFFTTALMDRHYRSDMSRAQAYALMIECVKEVQLRLVINLPNFAVKVVDKDGILDMETINPSVIARAA